MPKSVTFAWPSPFKSTFCGFTSRWIEPLLVREREAARDLDRELERRRDRDAAVPLDQPLQVLALDVLEDDELPVVVLAAVDHGDDVRMRERRDRARLAAEPLDIVLVGGVLVVEDLQRDLAVEQPVVRAVDARHATGADELLELVAT